MKALVSPIHGGPLKPTDDIDIFSSDYDIRTLYKMMSNGKIVPLISPSTGADLVKIDKDLFKDETMNEYYSVDDNGHIVEVKDANE